MCSRPSSRRYRTRHETVATNSVEPLSRNTFHRDGSSYYDITPVMPESVARLVSSGPAAEGQPGPGAPGTGHQCYPRVIMRMRGLS